MDKKELVITYLEALIAVLTKFSSPKYARMVTKQVFEQVKGSHSFISGAMIEENKIIISSDISKVEPPDIQRFFNDFTTTFKKKISHKELADDIFHDVQVMIRDHYEKIEEIELDAEYMKSLTASMYGQG